MFKRAPRAGQEREEPSATGLGPAKHSIVAEIIVLPFLGLRFWTPRAADPAGILSEGGEVMKLHIEGSIIDTHI